MKQFMFGLMVLLFVLVFALPALAQDEVTETVSPTVIVEETAIVPTAVAEEPAPVINPVEVTYDLSTILTGLIAAFLGGSFLTGVTIGGVLLLVVRSFNAVQKQALNHLFMSLPPGLQGDVRQTLKDVDEVVEFGKEITSAG